MYFSYILSGFFLIKDFWKKDLEECFVMIASHPREYYNDKSPLFLLCGITVWIFIGLYGFVKTNNNFMHGEEHGTAKWGDIAAFNHKYADFHNLQNNKILSQNVMFSYNESTLRNNNVFVCGGSGAGRREGKLEFYCMGVPPASSLDSIALRRCTGSLRTDVADRF